MNILINIFLVSYYGVPFLTLYPGAQPASMGGVSCAIADNAYANFYNPAGLGFQREVDFIIEYNSIPWLVGIGTKYWNFTNALPLMKSLTFGFFGSGVISSERYVFYEYLGYDFATGFSFGYKYKFLGAGISIKYIHSFFSLLLPELGITEGGTARSLAVDMGLLVKYSFPFGKIGAGIAIQNIGPGISYTPSSEKDPLPLGIRGGVSYTISAQEFVKDDSKEWFKKWFLEKWRVIIAYDINKVIEEKHWHSFGVEVRPVPFLPIRFGYFDGFYHYEPSRRKGWTVGLGLDLKFLRLDISDDSALYILNPNRFRLSLSLNIGEPVLSEKGLFGK